MSARHDFAYASRVLRRTPALSIASIGTLALAIAVTSAVFTVVYGVLLRPLPYPQSDELVRIWLNNPPQGIEKDITSYPNLLAWRERSRSFEYIVGVRDVRMILTGEGEPEEVRGSTITEGYFEMLGIAPQLGRSFTTQEASPDGPTAVVLSHELWATRFGSDAGVIGRSILLSGQAHPVVGVMPPEQGPSRFWIPQRFDAGNAMLRESWGALWIPVMGRLADGQTVESAQAEMSAIAATIAREVPTNEGMDVLLEPLRDSVVGDVRPGLLVLLGAVVFVLLIACANIANLLLARGAGRRREMAVRVALGAGASRLARLVLAESALLTLVGGLIGLLLAIWGADLLRSIVPPDLPRLDQIRVDGPSVLFTVVVTAIAGVLFGLAPTWQVARRDPAEFLSQGGRGASSRRDRLRPALVVAQFALALTLLAGAGLLLRSFANLLAVDRGFDTRNVLSIEFNLPGQRYGTGAAVRSFYDRLLNDVEAQPDVESAGLLSALFLSRLPQSASVFVEGRGDLPEVDRNLPVPYDAVSPSTFSTLRLPIVQGRAIAPTDRAGGANVAVVNRAFVARFLAGLDPIGRRFVIGDAPENDSLWITIVGVAANARRSGLDQEDRPSVFRPLTQYTPSRMTLLIRAAGDPLALVPRVRDVVSRIDAEQPMSNVRTLEQIVTQSVAARRFVMLLLVIFAACATLLAAVGIYGVMAYAVGHRTREIGVRVALGAGRSQVLGLVVTHALRQAALGLGLGLAAALALGRLLRGQLFGVSPADPLTLGTMGLLLIAVASLAAYLPARRAALIQPVEALRNE